jgi:ADP-ribose pyrophosphatase YjhB (NUDIX family)
VECTHSLIADVAVLVGERVLLVRYGDTSKYDDEPGWFLPDDVLRYLEHPTRAAKRIAKEQLRLELDDVRLEHVESFRGHDGGWHMSFHHLAVLPTIPDLNPSADLSAAEWFALNELPPRSEVAHKGWALNVLRKMDLTASR